MTLHSDVEYKCKYCDTHFVPIPEAPNCPKCSRKSETVYANFVRDTIHLAPYVEISRRVTLSSQWSVTNTGDLYYFRAFQFFRYACLVLEISEEELLERRFSKAQIDWLVSKYLNILSLIFKYDDDQPYWRHIWKTYFSLLLTREPEPRRFQWFYKWLTNMWKYRKNWNVWWNALTLLKMEYDLQMNDPLKKDEQKRKKELEQKKASVRHFVKIKEKIIIPAMEEVENKLIEKGHRIDILKEDDWIEKWARNREECIIMQIILAGKIPIISGQFPIRRYRDISRIKFAVKKGSEISKIIDIFEHVYHSQEGESRITSHLDVKKINKENVESIILKFINRVFETNLYVAN